MKPIETLEGSGVKRAMLYKYKGDDGISVEYSHGRKQWYRTDTRYFIDIHAYSYWD